MLIVVMLSYYYILTTSSGLSRKMIIYHSENHQLHAPEFEFYRGERVPCFESPQRADLVLFQLKAQQHELRLPDVDSTTALAQVHSGAYLEFLKTAWRQWLARDPGNATQQPFPSVWPIRSLRSDVEPIDFIAKLGLYSMDNGSPMVAGTWAAAKAAADAAASAATFIGAGHRSVFCAIRPPGHHAGKDFMGGYCFLNNAAVATQTLISGGIEKVAILDVDFHHGNGTQSIFYDRDDVLFASIHGDPKTEYPFYLGHADETGGGLGEGYNLNLPLPAGSRPDQWFAAFETASQRVKQHQAGALVVSLGLDTYAEDPISNFELQIDDFKVLGRKLSQFDLPTVIILEGGYATDDLGFNTASVIQGFEQAMTNHD
jgi:acetoin utilization deacetylase AcuC-like enzyme